MDTVIRSPRVSSQPRLLSYQRTGETTHTQKSDLDGAGESVGEKRQESVEFSNTENVDTHMSGSGSDIGTKEKQDPKNASEKKQDQLQADAIRAQIESELHARYAEEIRIAREQAIEEGRQQGYNTGYDEGLSAHSKNVESLCQLITGARVALDEGIEGLTDIAVELGFEAVTKILGKAIVNKEGLVAIVKELINRVKSTQELLIRVSAQDYQLLESAIPVLMTVYEGKKINIVADERVHLGGCLLETENGSLDGRLEIQLQNFMDTLLSAKARWPDPDLGPIA